jgi:hypothetical protein
MPFSPRLATMDRRRAPDAVALDAVLARYPDALVIVLAGSVVGGIPTSTSDLDVVVLLEADGLPRRESFTAEDWPIELFAHSPTTMRAFFEKDVLLRRPSMIRIWASGRVLHDTDGLGVAVQQEAQRLLEARYGGPSPAEVRKLRYLVTDLLDDLIGDPTGDESVFVAPTLAIALCHLKLLSTGAWTGTAKWMYREAHAQDPEWAEALVRSLREHAKGSPTNMIAFAERTLVSLGGRLFDGYSEPWEEA